MSDVDKNESNNDSLSAIQHLCPELVEYHVELSDAEQIRRTLGYIILIPFKMEKIEEECRPKEIDVNNWVQMPKMEKWIAMVKATNHQKFNEFFKKIMKASADPILVSKLINQIYFTLKEEEYRYITYHDISLDLFATRELRHLLHCFLEVAVI